MNYQAPPTRPKVIYFINSFDIGGAELGVIKLVEDGVFDGCDLDLVTIARGRGLEEPLSRAGCRVTVLSNHDKMRITDLPLAVIRFSRLLRRKRPNLLVLSLPQANLIGRLCAWFDRRIVVVSFEHNTHLAKPIYETGYRWTSSRVNWMLADSPSTAKEAAQRLYRHRPEKQTIVPLVSFVEPARRNRSSSDSAGTFHIVNAARLTATKNQSALIDAVAILVRSGRDVRLTLYGDGPERPSCEALVARLGLTSRVSLPGFVPDWCSRPADLFVLASKHEGLCISVLEAMQAGIPVVAPMIGGLCDYGSPEVMSVLSSVQPSALAEAIAAAISDRGLALKRAAAAADMIDRRYSRDEVRNAYRQINADLIQTAALQRK